MYFIRHCQRCWKWFSLAWRRAGVALCTSKCCSQHGRRNCSSLL